jgi:hypothetical protein
MNAQHYLIGTDFMRILVDADTYERGKDLIWYYHPTCASAYRARVNGEMITIGRFALRETHPDLQVWRIKRWVMTSPDGPYVDYRRENLTVRTKHERRPQPTWLS